MIIFLFILALATLTQHGSAMEIPRNTARSVHKDPISPWNFEKAEYYDQNLSNLPTPGDHFSDTDFTLNNVDNVYDGIVGAPIEISDAIKKYEEYRGLHQNLDSSLVDENIGHVQDNIEASPRFIQSPKKAENQRKLFEQITKQIFIDRIVEGQQAPDNSAPHQVSFRDPKHFCSGSIIGVFWILTAAHCVDNASPYGFGVVMGTNSLSRGGVTHAVDQIILHENWNRPTFTNDISLVHLERPIQYNNRVTYINLANRAPQIGSITRLTGWGYTFYPSTVLPDMLQYIDLYTVGWNDCKQALFGEGKLGQSISPANVCTFLRKGAGACINDSGGPLIQGNLQVGIVSWGIACAQGYPDVFTNVAYYLNWILSHAR